MRYILTIIFLTCVNTVYSDLLPWHIEKMQRANNNIIKWGNNCLNGDWGKSHLTDDDKKNLATNIQNAKEYNKQIENINSNISELKGQLHDDKKYLVEIKELKKEYNINFEKIKSILTSNIPDHEAEKLDVRNQELSRMIKKVKIKSDSLKIKNKPINIKINDMQNELNLVEENVAKNSRIGYQLIEASRFGYPDITAEQEQERFKEHFEKYRQKGRTGAQYVIPCRFKNCSQDAVAEANYNCPNGWFKTPSSGEYERTRGEMVIECK